MSALSIRVGPRRATASAQDERLLNDMKTIAFFNNKGGVGKTSLVYHLAWMYADLGLNVVAADLDPQANLTSMFLEDQRLEALWTDGGHKQTIYGAFQPLLEGTGDVAAPHVYERRAGWLPRF